MDPGSPIETLRVYVVLARGGAQPVTVVTAADMAGAARAFQRVCRLAAAATVEAMSPILVAELPSTAMPKLDASPAAWLMAVAGSPGAIALVEMDGAANVS